MNLLVTRGISLGAGNPEYHGTVTSVLLLEILYILTQILGVVPAGIGRHSPYGIRNTAKRGIYKILCVIGVKAGLHGLDTLQFVTNRLYILTLEHLTVEGALICIVSEYIPCTENHILEVGHGNYLTYMFVLLVLSASDPHLTQLGKGTDGICKTLAGHKSTGNEGCRNRTKSYTEDSKSAFGRFYVTFHISLTELLLFVQRIYSKKPTLNII